VAVKIKLKRLGKIRNAQYRIVIADARTARNGRAIEEIGIYHPKHDPSLIEVNSERAQYWLSVGAQPTEAVTAILKVTGDWQKFKGLPGAEGTLKVAPAKADKKAVFAAAVVQAAADKEAEAKAPKPKLEPKAEKPVEAPKVEEPAVVADAAPAVEAETAPAEAVESSAAESAEADAASTEA
jgi:small subunit ribosomal protein S16